MQADLQASGFRPMQSRRISATQCMLFRPDRTGPNGPVHDSSQPTRTLDSSYVKSGQRLSEFFDTFVRDFRVSQLQELKLGQRFKVREAGIPDAGAVKGEPPQVRQTF